MITPGELSRSLFGAWLLARFNADGLKFFDNTVEGFWRSFWAAAIILPAYAILLSLRHSNASIGVGAGTAFYVNSVSYVIGWLAFPFVMFYVARKFDRGQWYCQYINAFNWGVVLWVTLQMIVGLVVSSGLFPLAVGVSAIVIMYLFTFAYQGFIARVALQTTWPGTVGIVVLYLVLGLMLDGWTLRLLKLQPVVSG